MRSLKGQKNSNNSNPKKRIFRVGGGKADYGKKREEEEENKNIKKSNLNLKTQASDLG